MVMRIGILGVLAAWFLTGCSTHYYEGDSVRSAGDVKAFLGEVNAQSTQTQDGTVVYYGESTAKNIRSFLSFTKSDALGFDVATATNGARVFLLDNMALDGSLTLMIGLDSGNGYTYTTFTGTGDIGDDVFHAELTGGSSGTVVLESVDNDGKNLDDIIQLRVFIKDGSGQSYVGKISTLFAYQ